MNKEELVNGWINSLVENGFMHGWLGDKSPEFKSDQYRVMMKVLDGDVKVIGGNYRLLATIYSDYTNLKLYCGWDEKELSALLALFNFNDIKEVVALMNCEDRDRFMLSGKLRCGVEFVLSPRL